MKSAALRLPCLSASVVKPPGDRWRRKDFTTDARSLARALLGTLLIRRLDSGELLAGRIVETEAYLGIRDRASHAFGGRRTPRNETMYAAPGTAYVYFTYGMHFCFNVVCGMQDEPAAVLIRALEPVEGLDEMRSLRAAARRGQSSQSPQLADRDLCRGPARLCQALAIDRSLNGLDLTRDPRLWLSAPAGSEKTKPQRIVKAPRIGVDYAGEWAARPLRFMFAGSRCLSVRPKPTPTTGPKRLRTSAARSLNKHSDKNR